MHQYFYFRLIWASILISVTFLAAAWVFALLLVNVYGLDSSVLGWIFMAASIILVKIWHDTNTAVFIIIANVLLQGLWLFIFSFATMILNQVRNSPDIEICCKSQQSRSDPGTIQTCWFIIDAIF